MTAEFEDWETAVIQSLTGEWFGKARLGPPKTNEGGIKYHDKFVFTPFLKSKDDVMPELVRLIEAHS